MRFRWGDALLGFHKVWMEQVIDCDVWSTWFVLERKTIYKPEALANWFCWRLVGQSAASTASQTLVLGKAVQGLGRKGALAPVRGG